MLPHLAALVSPLRALFAAVILAGTLASNLASAQNPLIAEGQSLYDELRYEESLQTLSAALVRSGNSDQERITIYRLLAFTYLALNREEEAAGAYRSLLTINPDYVPADVSPRFREFFANIKSRWEADGRPGFAARPPAPVEIQHTSPPQIDPETEIELTAQISDPDGRVDSLVLAYRQGTSDVFQRIDCLLGDEGFTATIPASDVAPPLVEYYFEAIDAEGLPIAARGDIAAPLRITVNGEGGGVVTKWWFWTIIGAVVVGAAVATTVILLNRDEGPMQTPTGTLVVDIR